MDDIVRQIERDLWQLTARVAVLEQRLAVVTWVYRSMAGALIAAAVTKLANMW